MSFDLIRKYYKKQGYNIDEKYNFFYDETNNNIKYQFKNDKIPNLDDFIKKYRLGGIVLKKESINYDFDNLEKSLNLKNELKINSINTQKTDTFLNCLRGKRLELILDFICSNDILIHIYSFDNLYDVVIEIIDSLIMEEFLDIYDYLAPIMKNDLYKFVKNDLKRFMNYLKRYNYPNIESENIYDFCNDMYIWIDESVQKDFGLECCRQLFRTYRKKEKLLFLNGNKEKVIIDGYTEINFDMCLKFSKSFHFFDEITEVKKNLKKFPVDNYDFGDSASNFTLQLSDVIVGLLDRFFEYIDNTNCKDLEKELKNLKGIQKDNLIKFLNLYNKSVNENELFFGFYEPIDIVNYRNSIIYSLITAFNL